MHTGCYGVQVKRILAANGDGLYEYDVDEHKLVSVERSDRFGRLAHGIGSEHYFDGT